MNVTGKVLSIENSEPVPSATIALMAGNLTLVTSVAGSDGRFSISTNGYPDSLVISSSGYLTKKFSQAELYDLDVFYLERNFGDIPPVVVTTHKKHYWGIGIAILLLLTMSKRRK